MSKLKRGDWTAADYEQAAAEYALSQSIGHPLEGMVQATQRKITLESMDLLCCLRPGVRVFNELLVEYPFEGHYRYIVPGNMVWIDAQPPQFENRIKVEPDVLPPLLVLDYLPFSYGVKEVDTLFRQYERELKVPYCLMYDVERERLKVWRHTGKRYVRLASNAQKRYAISELELAVGVLAGWVRYWYRGELLLLPHELLQRAKQAEAEVAGLRALLEQSEKASPRSPRKRR